MGDPDTIWGGVLEALSRSPAGLLTDVDGTLSPIAPSPGEARVDPAARELLASLVGKLAVVAAITGRAPGDVREMVAVDGMTYVGNHGMEQWEDGRVLLVPEAAPYAGRVAPVLAAARAKLDIEGLLFEDKGITGAVHYRKATNPGETQARVRKVVEPLARDAGLLLHPGKMLIELRPAIELGKGAAAERLITANRLRGCIFIGDDTTDTDAFRVLRRLASAGEVTTVCVGVLSEETPPAIEELTDVLVDGVPGVVELLGWLDRKL